MLLVARNEEHREFRKTMLDLPTSEGPETASSKIAIALKWEAVCVVSISSWSKIKQSFNMIWIVRNRPNKTTYSILGRTTYQVDR